MLLWDARMPLIEQPSQFPHMLYWTRQGTIKKLMFRNMIPHLSFWLTVTQLSQCLEDYQVRCPLLSWSTLI
jgi:hypothetical protein